MFELKYKTFLLNVIIDYSPGFTKDSKSWVQSRKTQRIQRTKKRQTFMRRQRKLLDNYVQTLQWRGMNWTVLCWRCWQQCPQWCTDRILTQSRRLCGSVWVCPDLKRERLTLHTQRQQQYVRENGCARSAVRLLFAAVLWVLSGWRLLVPTADIACARNHMYALLAKVV